MCLCFKIWAESKQCGLSVERLNVEAGEPREVGMQQGDSAELKTRRWQKRKVSLLVGPEWWKQGDWVVERQRDKASKGRQKTGNRWKLRREGICTRQETGKGWTGGETSRKHLRATPSLHCTEILPRGRNNFPVIPAASTKDSMLWSRIMMYKCLYNKFVSTLQNFSFKRQDKEKWDIEMEK